MSSEGSGSYGGHIVSISVENFKTYKGRHTIGPFKQFTSIVGPNGCGKSNIMDAISFVLGLQARSLRCKHMKDLIFRAKGESGVRRRATVTLTYQLGSLDKLEGFSTGDQISFSRNISPSGSSTYRYNRLEVTLNEYSSHLASIGIVARGTNCLVAQGTVKDVGARNPKAMLELFEHVSGSADLKEEYEQAKADMDAREEATITLFQKKKEIAAERREAKVQSDEAKRFNAKLSEQARLKQQYYLWQLFHIEKDIRQRKSKHDAAVREARVLEKRELGISDQLQEKIAEHRAATSQVGALSKACAKLERRTEKARGAADELKAAVDDAKAAIQKSETAQTRQDGVVKKRRAEVERLEASTKETEEELADVADALHQGSGTSHHGSESDLAEYRKLKRKAAETTAVLKSKHQTALRLHQADMDQLTALRARASDLEQQIDLAERDCKDSDASIANSEAMIVKGEEELAAKTAAHRKLREQIDADLARKQAVERELADVEQLLRAAKDARRRSEHDERKAEALADMKRLFPGVRGRLVDLCRPTARKYEKAVVRVLGKHAESIVVDTEACGFECMGYLRSKAIGVADFLPLDTLRGDSRVDDVYRQLGAQYRLAVDVIDFNTAVAPAVQYACAGAVVCDDMKAARSLRYGQARNVKVVTLSGAVIAKNGNVTGGNTSFDSQLSHWEQAKLDKARHRMSELRVERTRLSRALSHRGSGSRSQQVEELARDITRHKQSIPMLRAHLKILKKSRTEAHQKLEADVRQLRSNVQPEITKLESEATKRADVLASCKRDLLHSEARVFGPFCDRLGLSSISEYESDRVKQVEETLKRQSQLQDKRDKLAAKLKHTASGLEDAIRRARSSRASTKSARKSLAQLVKKQKAAVTEVSRCEKSLAKQRADLDPATELQQTLREDVALLRTEKAKIAKAKRKANKAVTAQETMLAPARARRHDFLVKARDEEIALPMLDGTDSVIEDDAESDSESASQEQSQQTRGRFSQSNASTVRHDRRTTSHVDFSKLQSGRQIEDDLEFDEMKAEFERSLRNVHAELDQMQPNMKATERYEETKLRFAEAEKECATAHKAASLATQAFHEVKDRRTTMFRDAFDRVASVIDDVYKAMTQVGRSSGGKASLTLENDLEPFEGGVRFSVQPPAKRFRELEDMSSGEKAVATLALLFAIHSFKRAPFFILDEIDANLDKFNVQKVVNYVRMRSSDASPDGSVQCIVISLRSYFYEHAESLVGVCKDVANQGSSRVLTLDLRPYGHPSTPLIPTEPASPTPGGANRSSVLLQGSTGRSRSRLKRRRG